MKTRLVDPIHFFDNRGRSVLNTDHVEKQNRELVQENKTLRLKLRNALLHIKKMRNSGKELNS